MRWILVWLNSIASYFLGFPFRLLLAWQVKERLADLTEYNIRPLWNCSEFIGWMIDPFIFDDPNAGQLRNRIYLGAFWGQCRIGHVHYGPRSLISIQVLWWNFKNNTPLLRFTDRAANKVLNMLIEDMANCGFRKGTPVPAPTTELEPLKAMR